jgi:hypothetical protein
MKMTDDELRATHDDLDEDRARELAAFKATTAIHQSYLVDYKNAKRMLPRRPKDPKPDDEVTA